MRICIFHNNRREAMVFGYQHGHTITQVAAWNSRPDDGRDLLEHAFWVCNVGHEPDVASPVDTRATAYRSRGNRSFSVGDVIAIEDGEHTTYYGCASAGWDIINRPRLADRTSHGTTPHHATEPDHP